jgi:hypothetical protein
LLHALQSGDWSKAQALIAAGTDVETPDALGHTPLMLAAGHTAAIGVLRDLLAAGASVDTVNTLGWTALMVAAVADNVPAIYALLQAGADPAVADTRGETALTKARTAGRSWIVRILAKGRVVSGGDIGPTPLSVLLKGVAPTPPAPQPVLESEPTVPRPKAKAPVSMGILGRHLMTKLPPKPAPAAEVMDPNRPLRSSRPLWPNATLPMR